MAAHHATVVSVLDPSVPLVPASLAAALSGLRDAVMGSASAVDLVVVANGGLPFSEAGLAEVLDKVSDVQVFVLADEVDRDVAFVAGIEAAVGDVVLTLDPFSYDAQLLASMFAEAASGAEVVLVESTSRPSDAYGRLRRHFLHAYRHLGGADERDVLVQKLLARPAVSYVLRHGDAAVLLRTLAVRSGFKTKILSSPLLDASPRTMGSALAKAATLLTSGTTHPMRVAGFLSLAGAFCSLSTALYALCVLLFKEEVATGWPSLVLFVSGMFFVVCLVLALLSEYVVQIHARVVSRPDYYIAAEHRSQILTREQRLNIASPDVEASVPAVLAAASDRASAAEPAAVRTEAGMGKDADSTAKPKRRRRTEGVRI